MSHATVLVALSPKNIAKAPRSGKNGEDTPLLAAIAFQMAPFDEGGKWFAKGSRWDWWTVGGRWRGMFPGHRDVITRDEFEPEEFGKHKERVAEAQWVEIAKDMKKFPAKMFESLYGFPIGTTKDAWIAQAAARPFCCHSFLKDRKWHESGRLGWFGTSASTECERKAEEDGKEFVGRCIHKSRGAQIVSWTGPNDTEDTWRDLFYRRFVQDLPGDTTLVVVDYHV